MDTTKDGREQTWLLLALCVSMTLSGVLAAFLIWAWVAADPLPGAVLPWW